MIISCLLKTVWSLKIMTWQTLISQNSIRYEIFDTTYLKCLNNFAVDCKINFKIKSIYLHSLAPLPFIISRGGHVGRAHSSGPGGPGLRLAWRNTAIYACKIRAMPSKFHQYNYFISLSIMIAYFAIFIIQSTAKLFEHLI